MMTPPPSTLLSVPLSPPNAFACCSPPHLCYDHLLLFLFLFLSLCAA